MSVARGSRTPPSSGTGRTGLAGLRRALLRGALLLLIGVLALQLQFALRIVALRWFDPGSTSFQRSEAWRLLRLDPPLRWRHQPVAATRLSPHLERAVIASEDAGFATHGGLDWDAISRAWERNQRQQARAQARPGRAARLHGGSTITQQLAKNLFLSGERTVLRKAQEAVIALMLEALLPKPRILSLYLNHVEWGVGLFGAQAAAQRYFGVDADRLGPVQAARLAVMLPAPRRYEQRPDSPVLAARAAAVLARMPAVQRP